MRQNDIKESNGVMMGLNSFGFIQETNWQYQWVYHPQLENLKRLGCQDDDVAKWASIDE